MSRHEPAEQLFGVGDLDRVFSTGQSRAIAPWPRAGALKHGGAADRTLTHEQLWGPVWLTEVDPRTLWASQGWVVREHAEYYRTGTWEMTGETSANRDAPSNHWPIVMVDRLGRPVIRAGHHRSLVALIEGRPVLARLFPGEADGATAITPLLLMGGRTRLDHVACDEVDDAVRRIRDGRRVLCSNAELATAVARVVAPTLAASRLPAAG